MVYFTSMGRLTRDADLVQVKTAYEEKPAMKFAIATGNSKGRDGGTQFLECFMWGDKLKPYLTKGRMVLLQGRMEQKDIDKDGVKKRYITFYVDNLEFAGSQNEGGGDGGKPQERPEARTPDEFDDSNAPF